MYAPREVGENSSCRGLLLRILFLRCVVMQRPSLRLLHSTSRQKESALVASSVRKSTGTGHRGRKR